MKAITLVLTAILLAGCAGPQDVAARHDTECRRLGTKPGTDTHLRCRLTLAQRDDTNARAAAAVLAAGMQQASQAYYRAAQQPVYVPRTINCWRNGQHVTCR
jgi:hypothetical protein